MEEEEDEGGGEEEIHESAIRSKKSVCILERL